MPSLGHWKFPKSRSGRRSISVAKLLKREAEGVLFKKQAAMIPHTVEYVDNDFGVTGAPARARLRKRELPPRDEVDVMPNPKVENRHDSQGSITVGEFAPAGGFTDIGKTAMRDKISRAMETLGELSRTWKVPSVDEDHGAQQMEHHGPFGITLSEIGAADSGDNSEATRITKDASISFEAFIDELSTLNAVTPYQLQKAAEVTKDQAQVALSRLDELDHQRPTLGQLGRGAAVGSIVGPIASNVNKLISKGEFNTPREMVGQLAGGAVLGIAAPLLRHKVETGNERHLLRNYVNEGHGGRLATQIETKLETP